MLPYRFQYCLLPPCPNLAFDLFPLATTNEVRRIVFLMTFTIEYDDSLGQISCIVETLRRAWIVFQFLCFQLFLSDCHLIIMIDTTMIL